MTPSLMRIAFLHQPNDPYTSVRIRYFLSRGYIVFSIVFPSNSKQKPIDNLNILTLPDLLINRIPLLKRIIYGYCISQITKRNKIDILYIISALNSFYLWTSSARKNILEIQGSDVIFVPQKFIFLKPFYRFFWRFADGITQDSQLAAECGKKYMPGSVPNSTIEIGVDFQIFNSKVKSGIMINKLGLKDRLIVFHSRSIRKLYNVDILIQSIPLVKEKFTNICYVLTGDHAQLGRNSKKFIKQNKLESNIIFCGRLDHVSEMKYYNKDSDVVVSIPSSDSSPFSVYEAMATKTPVIASDLPWINGKFIPDKHLLIVPVRSSKLLAEAILKVLGKEIKLDVSAAYQLVFRNINMVTENEKLEAFLHNIIC
jgi:glycosyltransferase involved in cell wall biosynthesis